MQDNALIYKCKAAMYWLETHRIHTIEWPPNLPDLNPIEHLWWVLKKTVHKLYPKLNTIGSLEKA